MDGRIYVQINGRASQYNNCVHWSDKSPHFIIEQAPYISQVIVSGEI